MSSTDRSPETGTNSNVASGNAAVVKRALEEYWSGETTDDDAVALLEEVFASDYSEDDPAAPWFLPGRAGLWRKRALLLEVFPDLHAQVQTLLPSGERVVACWTFTGTHQGEIFGIAPSGRSIHIKGTSVYRLHNHRIVSHTATWDRSSLLRQLGADGEGESWAEARLHDVRSWPPPRPHRFRWPWREHRGLRMPSFRRPLNRVRRTRPI